jgi:hypothetical protein
VETFCATTSVGAILDVIENFRMLVKHGVDEADWAFTSSVSFLVDLDDGQR